MGTALRAAGNRCWPAVCLVDGDARGRFRHVGEGAYEETERAIQELLGIDEPTGSVDATGVAEVADWATLNSPETYVGRARRAPQRPGGRRTRGQ